MAAPNAAWIHFLRKYGPIKSNENCFDELIERARRRAGVEAITVAAPRVDEAARILSDTDMPSSVILTGDAGDGKTYHCRQIWQRLGGTEAAWESDEGDIPGVKELSVAGRQLWVVRDLSELDDLKLTFFAELFKQLADPGRSRLFLIAANVGQLHDRWKAAAAALSNRFPIGETSWNDVEAQLFGRPATSGNAIKLFHLGRGVAEEIFSTVVDAVIEHKAWEQCGSCELREVNGKRCPILENRHRLRETSSGPLFRERLADLVMLNAQNQRHFTIRQILMLVSNVLLGHPNAPKDRLLRCDDVVGIHANDLHGAGSVYANVVGENLVGRQRETVLDVRGYSHIFVSGPSDAAVQGEQELLSPSAGEGALQEVFAPAQVRELILRYAKDQPLTSVRETLGTERPWEKMSFDRLAAKPRWHVGPLQPSGTEDSRSGPTTGAGPSEPPSAPSPSAQRPPPVATEASEGPPVEPLAGSAPGDSPIKALIASRGRAAPSQLDSPWLGEAVAKLRRALATYQLQSTVIGSRLTPNTALIRLQGSDRLTVKDIEQRRSQLLTTHGLTIVSTAARPGEVVMSIARPQREVISLWDVMRAHPSESVTTRANLSLLVGIKELDGEPLMLNLTEPPSGGTEHAPHTLIAGTTGSGKSVLIQNLLLDLALKNHPAIVKVTIIDPKMGVDYFSLEQLPHLSEGVVTTQERALEVLNNLVMEMERRYRLFAGPRVNKLATFNERVEPADRLPWLVIVHDEFADWMQTEDYRDQVTALVNRLSVKARAAGIHLVFAAQRPDVSVMPMQLRDNLGNRLILRVEAEGTSEFTLNERGAERLLGRGHIACRLQGEDIQLAQVPWMSPDDAERFIQALRNSIDSNADRGPA